MDQRRAFIFAGFVILMWLIFWNTSIRRVSVWRNSVNPDSSSVTNAALRGALVAI